MNGWMDGLAVWVKIANMTVRRLRILSNRVSEEEAGGLGIGREG